MWMIKMIRAKQRPRLEKSPRVVVAPLRGAASGIHFRSVHEPLGFSYSCTHYTITHFQYDCGTPTGNFLLHNLTLGPRPM